MRAKSVEKYKAKIRELTPRHHNLDQEVVAKVNAVIRGTAGEILARSAPAAASWWQQHRPQLLQSRNRLVFPADICQAEES
jgi:hypothetical protein